MDRKIAGRCYERNGIYILPDDDLTSDDVLTLVRDNEGKFGYKENYDLYVGNHPFLLKPKDPTSFRPDNRLVSNWFNYVVDTYVGYFAGEPVKISFKDDNKAKNEALQSWLDANSLQDKLSEIAKQVAIYGRSYLVAYQTEKAETKTAVVNPTQGFMIYDASINPKPLAFVRYTRLDSKLTGEVYGRSGIYLFDDDGINEKVICAAFDGVPAVEFYANEERLSIVGKIKTLVEAYNKTFSQKANQVQYFDAAYLAILGIQLPKDDDGNDILDLGANNVLYSPSADSANGRVEFLSKPDGDNMQENMLNRLVNDIFQTAMVANLNDEAFSGNSSGVAIRYKLLAMQNQASIEERKFKQAIKEFLSVALSAGTTELGSISKDDVLKNIDSRFTRNIPVNLADEASTAKTLEGVVSKETQLKALTIVDDPKTEIERIASEKEEAIKQSLQNSANAIDMLGGGTDDKSQERSLLEEKTGSRKAVDSAEPK